MFENHHIEIDDEIGSCTKTSEIRNFSAPNYLFEKKRAEHQLKENIAKLPRWRRWIMEIALECGW